MYIFVTIKSFFCHVSNKAFSVFSVWKLTIINNSNAKLLFKLYITNSLPTALSQHCLGY